MFRSPLRFVLLFLLLESIAAHAGIARYSDRGKTDFDTVLQVLNPYGTWSQIGGTWAYTPFDHQAPYTNGRWLYTDFGWYWQGNLPHSWVTEHYGYWKRGEDHLWSWYPGPYWLAEIVEIRATGTSLGWRSAAVDDDGTFVEAPADRYAKTDEWSFVTKAQFSRPITPDLIAKPTVAAADLDDSTDSTHAYFTYRPIDRPGPHPADLVSLASEGGMFPSPLYVASSAQASVVPDVTAKIPKIPTPSAPVPAGIPSGLAVPVTSASSESANANDPPPDMRQVLYWTTMSLPTYWTPRPTDAKPNEIYVYRPEFYQDPEGIQRRISLWLNPGKRSLTTLKEVLTSAKADDAPTKSGGNAEAEIHSSFDDAVTPDAPPAAHTAPPAKTTNVPGGLQ